MEIEVGEGQTDRWSEQGGRDGGWGWGWGMAGWGMRREGGAGQTDTQMVDLWAS